MTIDEETTFKEKGYRSTDLSKGSHKRVLRICERCGQNKWVEFRATCRFCDSCSTILNNISRKHPLPAKEELVHHYIENNKTCREIGDIYAVSSSMVENWLTSFDIEKRHGSEALIGRQHGYKKTVTKAQLAALLNAAKAPKSDEHKKKLSISKLGEKNPNWHPKTKITCSYCGKEFEVRPSHKDAKFCSKRCYGRSMSGENHPLWNGGASFGKYCFKFNEHFKESIREKFGRVCFLCGKTEKENGKKLSVHHVSYDKNCMCDGIECKFVPLCSSCHTKTNFNRDLWEQHFTYLLAERGLLQHQKQSTLQQHEQEQQTKAFS